jgi:hypothetical protein
MEWSGARIDSSRDIIVLDSQAVAHWHENLSVP